jgi:hypothetical protein
MKFRVASRRARQAITFGLGAAIMVVGLAGASAAPSDPGCQPGSGPKLAGAHLTDTQISSYNDNLMCANLTGADLSGLSLVQIDFTGAIMRNANLQHADLTQATISYADLSGANLTDATMIQVTAHYAKMVGANLSGVDLTQADLTQADLSKANLSGTSFSETTLDHTTFTGATGVPPFGLFVGIVAVLILLLLLWGSVRRSLRGARTAGGFGYSNTTGSNPVIGLIRGILGSVIVALGFNLCIGGFLGEVVSAAGPPVSQTCTGALCAVGVSSGFIGIFGGVVLIIVGFVIRAVRQNSQQQAVFPGAGPGSFDAGPFNSSPPFN